MTRAEQARPPVVSAVGWLAVLAAVGSALMAVAHAGMVVPLVSALGPGGDDAVPPAVVSFAVGAVAFAVCAVALFTLRVWAWPLALVVFTVTLAGAAIPFRGVGSALGIAVCVVALALLMSRPGRETLLYRGHPG